MCNKVEFAEKERVVINLLKGLAIFLMLWGHCIQYCIPLSMDFYNNTMFKIIYSFHMPLFMLVSGYLFFYSSEKRNLKDLLVHRCQGLLHTIIFGGVFIYFTRQGLMGILKGEFSVLMSGKWLNSLSELWFLWSVLSSSLVLGFVYKFVKSKYLQILLLMLGFIFVIAFPNGVLNVYMYPYYVMGFYFAKYKNLVKKWIINLKYLSLIIFPIMMLFFRKDHFIYTTGLYGEGLTLLQAIDVDLFRYVIGLIGSIFIITLVHILLNFVNKREREFFLCKGLCCMGKKSLQIYVLSVVVLSYYLPIAYNYVINMLPTIDVFFANNIWLYNLGLTLILTVFYGVIIMFMLRLFDRIKLSKILFGK